MTIGTVRMPAGKEPTFYEPEGVDVLGRLRSRLGKDAQNQLGKYMAKDVGGSPGDHSPPPSAGFIRLAKFADPNISDAEAAKRVNGFHSHLRTELMGTFSSDSTIALRNQDSPFGRGILTMSQMMALLNYVANAVMDDIDAEQNVAKEAQNRSNDVAALIAKITDPSKKDQDQALTPDIIKYLQANGISVDGVDLNKPGQYDKATLQLVKNAIDNVQTSASNFVQTAQLKIQQVMQTYNIATQMVNSLLSIGAEMNKSIASSIR